MQGICTCTWPGCINPEESSTDDRILGERGSKKPEDSSTGEKFCSKKLEERSTGENIIRGRGETQKIVL